MLFLFLFQATSISKAINQIENPVKEKHVRSILYPGYKMVSQYSVDLVSGSPDSKRRCWVRLGAGMQAVTPIIIIILNDIPGTIIGTFHEKGANTFWNYALRLPLQENRIVAWKFCHVLHKVLREGHPKVLDGSQRFRPRLDDLGKLWVSFLCHCPVGPLQPVRSVYPCPSSFQLGSEVGGATGDLRWIVVVLQAPHRRLRPIWEKWSCCSYWLLCGLPLLPLNSGRVDLSASIRCQFGFITLLAGNQMGTLSPRVYPQRQCKHVWYSRGWLQVHLREGYGKLIQLYCTLLMTKLDFHRRNPRFPGNLQLTREELESIGENDINN
ncbi:hypothetical protein PR048_010045 [Dryococelus australis]|uniref:AP180 N-terminal homology (ANTH) domain-containing protein n=1 Tax=Dryococelus australis TaxID=614101 RepID=A0ABQ9I1M0_9NEOP|nr:hypothetical protein PR048_010045 [Dryococelus australis]